MRRSTFLRRRTIRMSALAIPRLEAVASILPAPQWSTTELLDSAHGHLSDLLIEMFGDLGVEKRHSVLSNYPGVLFGGEDPKLEISPTELAVKVARKCLASADIQPSSVVRRPSSVGLVLGVTSSPGRLLPSLVCDVMAQMPELPRNAATPSISLHGLLRVRQGRRHNASAVGAFSVRFPSGGWTP
jgi:hypothetical protein